VVVLGTAVDVDVVHGDPVWRSASFITGGEWFLQEC